MSRNPLPPRRRHITQKAKIGGRTIYVSVGMPEDSPADALPTEVFLRIKGHADAEKIVAYDMIARLISLGLQEGISITRIGECLLGTKDYSGGPVQEDTRIKMCHGTIDYVAKYLLVYYGGRNDLAHNPDGQTETQTAGSGQTDTASEIQPKKEPPPEGKTYAPVAGNH